MKQFLFVALAVVTGLGSALGNLGDGSERIENLYGDLVQRQLRDDGTVSVVYHKDRYLYFVIFANDRRFPKVIPTSTARICLKKRSLNF